MTLKSLGARSVTRRNPISRVATALIAGALVAGVAACGSSKEVDSPGGRQASTSAPTAAPPAAVSEAERTHEESDPGVIAQNYVQWALSTPDVINSKTIEEAVNKGSAFFTDTFANELIEVGHADQARSFRILPWTVDGFALNGVGVTDADVTIVQAGTTGVTAEYTQVMVVADFKWTFGDQGWASNTRTYHLTMVPRTEANSMQWLINGIDGSDEAFKQGT